MLKRSLVLVNRSFGTAITTSQKVQGEGYKWSMDNNLPLLSQVSDYVDKDISFVHPGVSWRMKFSSDLENVQSINKIRDSDQMCTYWPPSCLYHNDLDVIDALTSEYVNWDVTERLSDTVIQWAQGCSRIFAAFDAVPFDQLSFAHRHFTTTFYIDDPFEKICRNGTRSTFGFAYLSNLRAIVTDNHPNLIDLSPFESDVTSKKLIEDAEFAQDAWRSVTCFGREVLTRELFDYHKHNCLWFIEYLFRESGAYEKNITSKSLSNYDDLLETRVMTAGFELVMAGIMPPKESNLHILNCFNPFVHQGSVIVAMDNDLASAPKESLEGGEDSPSNLMFTVKHSMTEVQAVRKTLNKRNNIARCMEKQTIMMPKSWRRIYQRILNYTLAICDYEYVLGKGTPNPRYGFTWVKNSD